MTRTAAHDSIVRMALLCWLCDRASTLTPAQRQWVLALGQRTTPLTTTERARIRAPLLAWVAERQPRIYDIVAAQFTEEDLPHAEG